MRLGNLHFLASTPITLMCMVQDHIMWNTDLEPLTEHDVRVLKQARRLAIVNDINIVIKRKNVSLDLTF